MKVISANILGDFLSPKARSWDIRREQCLKTLSSQNPDIICTQELSLAQYKDFKQALGNYTGYDEKLGNYHPLNCIWVKNSAFTIIQQSNLNLPNGEKKHKRIKRYLNVIKLKHIKSKQELVIANTHLNYDCSKLALEQTIMINKFLNDNFPNTWIILCGDFNHERNSTIIQEFFNNNFQDTYEAFHNHSYNGPTFHSFDSNFIRQAKIDWILTNKNKIEDAKIISSPKAEEYGSDHFFISATFSLL